MSLRPYKPKLSVELPQETHDALNRLLPHAMKSPIIRAMLEQLIRLLSVHPNARVQICNLILLHELDVAKQTYESALEPGGNDE